MPKKYKGIHGFFSFVFILLLISLLYKCNLSQSYSYLESPDDKCNKNKFSALKHGMAFGHGKHLMQSPQKAMNRERHRHQLQYCLVTSYCGN